jgi:hypothetical protein
MSNTPTAARTYAANSAHWYDATTGEPRYQIPTVDGKKMKVPTLADARKFGFLPSVTTILDAVLRKPALEAWKTEQAVLACLTAPRKEGEADDAFVHRVLQDEQQQNQEAKAAADVGTQIHTALEAFFDEEVAPPAEMMAWIMPAAQAVLAKFGKAADTERILVGDGYAGKTDLLLEAPECWWLLDFKSTKKLPDPMKGGAWMEHRLQLSAYAAALAREQDEDSPTNKPIRTANVYISTITEGKFAICEHEDWQQTYTQGFQPLLTHWQWSNKYWTQKFEYRLKVPEKAEVAERLAEVLKEPEIVIPPAPPKRKIVMAIGIPTRPTTPPPEAA